MYHGKDHHSINLSPMKLLFISIFLLFALALSAQPGNPSNPAPLGFVEVALLAGGFYGAYRARGKRK